MATKFYDLLAMSKCNKLFWSTWHRSETCFIVFGAVDLPIFSCAFIFSTWSWATFIFSKKIDLCLGYDLGILSPQIDGVIILKRTCERSEHVIGAYVVA
jgi:hypothetical protein